MSSPCFLGNGFPDVNNLIGLSIPQMPATAGAPTTVESRSDAMAFNPQPPMGRGITLMVDEMYNGHLTRGHSKKTAQNLVDHTIEREIGLRGPQNVNIRRGRHTPSYMQSTRPQYPQGPPIALLGDTDQQRRLTQCHEKLILAEMSIANQAITGRLDPQSLDDICQERRMLIDHLELYWGPRATWDEQRAQVECDGRHTEYNDRYEQYDNRCTEDFPGAATQPEVGPSRSKQTKHNKDKQSSKHINKGRAPTHNQPKEPHHSQGYRNIDALRAHSAHHTASKPAAKAPASTQPPKPTANPIRPDTGIRAIKTQVINDIKSMDLTNDQKPLLRRVLKSVDLIRHFEINGPRAPYTRGRSLAEVAQALSSRDNDNGAGEAVPSHEDVKVESEAMRIESLKNNGESEEATPRIVLTSSRSELPKETPADPVRPEIAASSVEISGDAKDVETPKSSPEGSVAGAAGP
ncbi:hypothetical protein MBLNU230_g4783t1 [Neophaeotheca triangularis]